MPMPKWLGELGEKAIHGAEVAGEAAQHALPNTIGFLGDVGYDALQAGQQVIDPKHDHSQYLVLPGTGPISRDINERFSKAEDEYTHGKTPQPRNEFEKHLANVSGGAATGLLAGGPRAAMPLLIGGGAGTEVGSDVTEITGDPTLGYVAGAVSGGLAGAGPHIARSVRTGMKIRAGASMPEFAELAPVVLANEGGGTLEHPNVNKKSGAMGPQQVTPETARDPGYGIRPWDGKSQADLARVGRQKLAVLTDMFDGDYAKILAAYNWGEGNVKANVKAYGNDWWHHLPEETANYVAKGLDQLDGQRPTSVPPIDPAEIARVMGDPENAANDAVPEEMPEEADNVTDISDRFIEPGVRQFHSELMADVGKRVEEAKARGQQFHDEGKLPYDVGDQFTTPKSREDPWTVIGHYVDPKNPERYGYYVERGAGEDLERSQMLVSDPAADARMLQHMPEWDRAAHVAEWENLSKPKDPIAEKAILDSSHEKFTNYEAKEPLNDTSEADAADREGLYGFGGEKEPPSGGGGGPPQEPPKKPSRSLTELTEALAKAIKDAKKLTPVQVAKRSLEMTRRVSQVHQAQGGMGGLSSHYAALKALKGELPKTSFESIAHQFSPKEVDTLVNAIHRSDRLTGLDKVSTVEGLRKILGEEGGGLPQMGQLNNLYKVFGRKVVQNLLDKRPLHERSWDILMNALSTPKTMMAGGDVSAAGRQGVLYAGRKQFYTAGIQMFKDFSPKEFKASQDAIFKDEDYLLSQKGGLSLADPDSPFASDREDRFRSSYAEHMPGEKVPGIGLLAKGYNKTYGKFIAASDRAYTGFMNKLRYDTFKLMKNLFEGVGRDLEEHPKELSAICRFINVTTGRGSLGYLERISGLLNSVLFSPRMMSGHIQSMFDPRVYLNMPKGARVEAAKIMLTYGAIYATVLGLAHLGGAQVETDPRSSDAYKIKIKNTTQDFTGGRLSYLRLGAELITNSKITQKGEVQDLEPGVLKDTRASIVERFLRGKESPTASFVHDWAAGENFVGEPFDLKEKNPLKNPITSRMIPMVIGDTADAREDLGDLGGAGIGIESLFGINVNTHLPKEKTSKRKGFSSGFDSGFKSDFSKGEFK
jgi:hypothetical protein